MKYTLRLLCLLLTMAYGISCSDQDEAIEKNTTQLPEVININLAEHPEMILAEYIDEDMQVQFIESSPGSITMAFQFHMEVDPTKVDRIQSLLDEVYNNQSTYDELYKKIAQERAKSTDLEKLKQATLRFKTRENQIANGIIMTQPPTESELSYLRSLSSTEDRSSSNQKSESCIPDTSGALSFFVSKCIPSSAENQNYKIPGNAITKICAVNTTYSSDNTNVLRSEFYRMWGIAAGSENAHAHFQYKVGNRWMIYNYDVLAYHVIMLHQSGIGFRSSYMFSACNVHHAVLEAYPYEPA